MAKLTLRLAILECDIPIDPILNKYGTYGDRFKERFGAAADSIKHPGISSKSGLEVSAYEVITAQVYPPLKDVDAILITGSQFTAFNDDPWILKLVQYVKDALKEDRIKVVGVCFGHQILGRALGATVKRGEAWEIAVAPVDLTKKGQEVFERPALAVQQMRRDIVLDYPDGIEETAYTSHCTHGMYKPNKLISIQGHPEYNSEMMRWLIESRHKRGVLDDATTEDGLARVDKYSDGQLVIETFLRFLMEGRD